MGRITQVPLDPISIRIAESDVAAWSDWTESVVGEAIAIVVEGEVLSVATVKARLPDSFVLEGGSKGFSEEHLARILAALGAG